MPKNKKLAETKTDDTAERLAALYLPHGTLDQGNRNRLSRRLFKLAEVAGIPDARRTRYRTRPNIYTQAAALGFGDSFEADALRREIKTAEQYVATLKQGCAKPAEQKPAPSAQEARADITRDEFLANGIVWERRFAAERDGRLPLAAVEDSGDHLKAYGIHSGDIIFHTLDGDVEHGELAVATYHCDEEDARIIRLAFVFVEGAHFCLRHESHLECDGDHRNPAEITVHGRVVAVERGGLPVRLKGLELRGLPWAEEPEPTKERRA